MAAFVKVDFVPLQGLRLGGASPEGGAGREPLSLVVFVGEDLKPAAAVATMLGAAGDIIGRVAAVAGFKGKSRTTMEILAPAGLAADRLVVVGIGKDMKDSDFVTLGGTTMGRIRDGSRAIVAFDLPGEAGFPAGAAADFALGLQLRAYRFDTYKTKKDEADKLGPAGVSVAVKDVEATQAVARSRTAVAEGVQLARTLVNEPPNILFPIEFARRAAELGALGVEVEVLDVAAAEKLGMRALLAVGQGSAHESRVVVMRWAGAEESRSPSSARASASTPAAYPSSLQPAWKT